MWQSWLGAEGLDSWTWKSSLFLQLNVAKHAWVRSLTTTICKTNENKQASSTRGNVAWMILIVLNLFGKSIEDHKTFIEIVILAVAASWFEREPLLQEKLIPLLFQQQWTQSSTKLCWRTSHFFSIPVFMENRYCWFMKTLLFIKKRLCQRLLWLAEFGSFTVVCSIWTWI